MKRPDVILGLGLTFFTLIIHMVTLDDYGATWDFHHHFFAGLHLINHPITPDLTNHLPFSEPDPRGTYKLPFGPLVSIAPMVTYVVFFEKLKLLAFDNAYNLSIVFGGVAGILFLFLFLLEAKGLPTSLAGFVFILLFPRYFGDLHNNMKDVPQAATFTLAIWLFWRLVKYQRFKDLLLAALAFAIAFNTKVNTIAIPVIAGLWLIISGFFLPRKQVNQRVKNLKTWFTVFYFLLAPLLAFLVWAFFWKDPIGQLLYLPRFFRDNTLNIEVLLNGKWYCSGANVPWYYPLYYLAITTPLPMLLAAIVGFFVSFKTLKKDSFSSLLLLWFFIPIVRYIFPQMGVIDGLRHFEEVIFPLSGIAAIGAVWVLRKFQKIATPLVVITLFSLIIPIIQYHPFEIAYFNELVGGIRGAFGNYDLDYWGTSQKAAMRWLNLHAATDSKIYVVMAADVAGKYLRPDLRQNLNTVGYDNSDYVVVLNRQGFFYRYLFLWEYILRRKPAYVVSTQSVPLTWVFDNHLGLFPRQKAWWIGEDPCLRKYW